MFKLNCKYQLHKLGKHRRFSSKNNIFCIAFELRSQYWSFHRRLFLGIHFIYKSILVVCNIIRIRVKSLLHKIIIFLLKFLFLFIHFHPMKLMQKKAKYAEKNFITIYIDIRLLCCCGYVLFIRNPCNGYRRIRRNKRQTFVTLALALQCN